jgi:hypothetical protein
MNEYCSKCGSLLRLQDWLIGHECGVTRDYIYPSPLPDGPERDAWLEAEAEYSCKHDPPLKLHPTTPVPEKADRGSWLHRFCAWMMK